MHSESDEVIPGPLKGVRFWTFMLPGTYDLPPRSIRSFQYYHEWVASRPTQSDLEPTVENARGLNVYKTEADALRGSADAVNGVLEMQGRYDECKCGLVLGEVDIWGPTVEHEFGYHAQYVKPRRFLYGWGHKPEQMVNDLNVLWFANSTALSFSERMMLVIQRNGYVTAADIPGVNVKQASEALTKLEAKDFAEGRRVAYDDGVIYQPQKEEAWAQGQCLSCLGEARAECKDRKPRVYKLTRAGQDALLSALRGGKYELFA